MPSCQQGGWGCWDESLHHVTWWIIGCILSFSLKLKPDRFRLWTRWFQINMARKGSTILTAVYPGQMACPIEPAIYLLAVLDNTEVGDCCNDNKGLNRLEQQHTSFSCWLQPEATFSKKNSPHWKAGKSNLSQLRADPLLIGWDQLSGKLLITDFSPHQCPHKDHWSSQHYNSFFFHPTPVQWWNEIGSFKKAIAELSTFTVLSGYRDAGRGEIVAVNWNRGGETEFMTQILNCFMSGHV